MKTLASLAAAAVIAAIAGSPPTQEPEVAPVQQFDHAKHEGLGCVMCHANVAQGQVYPDRSLCASCHDGQMQPTVGWQPPTGPRGANLRFRHEVHPLMSTCEVCHPRGGVVAVDQCLACHGIQGEHQDATVSTCETCHVQPPAPVSHGHGWGDAHTSEAAAAPERCATCHVRSDCLDCHRPSGASPGGGYHPADFLQRHPTSAYNRETSCSDCHNVGYFCQSCHQQAGLVAQRALGSGYHDGNRAFIAGHGQAARQNLESCVSCHAERDCLQCHTRLNPHGPDFDADRLRARNADMCAICHGTNIPGGA